MIQKIKCFQKIDYIGPGIHFLLTFLFERLFNFRFYNNWEVVRTTALNTFFSDTFEMVMAYTIDKVMAAIIIWCIWKLALMMWRKQIPVKTSILFSALFCVGTIILFFLFPGCFETSGDNYIAYAQAVNFIPCYWFSVYTSGFYAACMMVFPHPFMIVCIHWLGLVFAIGYMYHRIETSNVIPNRYKGRGFLLFLFPIVHVILMDAYRTELYCVLCLIYMIVIVLDILEKRNRPVKEVITIGCLASVVGVWRTEGIVLAGISFLALLLFTYRETWKKGILCFGAFILAFIIMSFPQKVGDIKYYRNDYTIINLTRPVGMIFNSPSPNLDYEGAQEDIAAIDKVIPITYLQEYLLDGFRRNNYQNGSKDINQSMASKKDSDAFVRACYRLILHNLDVYLDTQLYLWNNAMGTIFPTVLYSYEGIPNSTPEWNYDMWDVGMVYFSISPLTEKWRNNEIRLVVEEKLLSIRETFLAFFHRTLLKYAINVLALLFIVWVAIAESIRWIKGRCKEDTLAFIAWAIVCQVIAIVLCKPAGLEADFRGTYFSIYAIFLLYPIRLWLCNKE